MFADLDGSLREMGAADLGVGKRIKPMTEALNGRIQAYDAGLADRRRRAGAGDPAQCLRHRDADRRGQVRCDGARICAGHAARYSRARSVKADSATAAADCRRVPEPPDDDRCWRASHAARLILRNSRGRLSLDRVERRPSIARRSPPPTRSAPTWPSASACSAWIGFDGQLHPEARPRKDLVRVKGACRGRAGAGLRGHPGPGSGADRRAASRSISCEGVPAGR